MSESSAKWGLTVLAVYSQRWSQRVVQEFQEGVSSLLEDMEGRMRTEHPSLHLKPLCLTAGHQDDQQAELGMSIAFAILDVTDCDDDLAFLAGQMQGAQIPHVLVYRKGSGTMTLPRGLSDARVVPYDSTADLFRSDSLLYREVSQAISSARVLEELVYELWFPRDTNTIWVVCPQVHNPGEFADRSSPDYTYLDNLGDTDALLEVMVFLSRYYPKATIEKFSSADLPRDHTKGNLVVIGGPGSPTDISNHVCQEMMSSVGSRVSYSEDCERMFIASDGAESLELRAELRSEIADPTRSDYFNIRRDYGYFARFANPLNEDTTVVLVNGIHTAGVRGAAKAFSVKEALRNYHSVFNSAANPRSFECHFEVEVLNGDVKVPSVLPDGIYTLGPTKQSSLLLDDTGDAQHDVEKSSRVTILFVAGDRGGGQHNQIQIPREIESIKEAIQGSQRREAFSLAHPLLAATHAKLVAAYRDQPVILHFAGHGDDRSLSFISDQGLLVSQIPIIAEQLTTILSNFPNRVRLCVFNTCDSASVAKYLADAHAVEAAIGWPAKVDDAVAIAFSRALYGRLGDGLALLQSMTLASESYGSGLKPVLYTGAGINPGVFTFATRTEE